MAADEEIRIPKALVQTVKKLTKVYLTERCNPSITRRILPEVDAALDHAVAGYAQLDVAAEVLRLRPLRRLP